MKHLLIKRKIDDAVLLAVEENQTYRLPVGYSINDVKIEVWNNGSIPAITTQPEAFRYCTKCGEAAFWQNTCCSERAAGFRGKWICSSCKFTRFVR